MTARPPRSFRRSFVYAWHGLTEGAVRDRNLRVHLALGILAGAFAAQRGLSAGERALLLLCVAVVVAAEAANSAIEAVVDLTSPGVDERARVAKDSAAAAVLALAAGSVLVFLAVAERALRSGATVLGDLGGAALAAGVAAASALALATPWRRPRAASVVLALAGAAGIAVVGLRADSQVGTAAAALCFAVAVAAGLGRRP